MLEERESVCVRDGGGGGVRWIVLDEFVLDDLVWAVGVLLGVLDVCVCEGVRVIRGGGGGETNAPRSASPRSSGGCGSPPVVVVVFFLYKGGG